MLEIFVDQQDGRFLRQEVSIIPSLKELAPAGRNEKSLRGDSATPIRTDEPSTKGRHIDISDPTGEDDFLQSDSSGSFISRLSDSVMTSQVNEDHSWWRVSLPYETFLPSTKSIEARVRAKKERT